LLKGWVGCNDCGKREGLFTRLWKKKKREDSIKKEPLLDLSDWEGGGEAEISWGYPCLDIFSNESMSSSFARERKEEGGGAYLSCDTRKKRLYSGVKKPRGVPLRQRASMSHSEGQPKTKKGASRQESGGEDPV